MRFECRHLAVPDKDRSLHRVLFEYVIYLLHANAFCRHQRILTCNIKKKETLRDAGLTLAGDKQILHSSFALSAEQGPRYRDISEASFAQMPILSQSADRR
jgi:hypothetical protein